MDFCQRFQKLIMTQLDSIKSLTSVIFGTFLETSIVTESQKKTQTEKLKCQNILFSDFSSLLMLNIQNLAESCANNIGTEWANTTMVIFQFQCILINVIALNSNDNELRSGYLTCETRPADKFCVHSHFASIRSKSVW